MKFSGPPLPPTNICPSISLQHHTSKKQISLSIPIKSMCLSWPVHVPHRNDWSHYSDQGGQHGWFKASSHPKGSQHTVLPPVATYIPQLRWCSNPFYNSFLPGYYNSIKSERMNETNEIEEKITRTTKEFKGEKVEETFMKLHGMALNLLLNDHRCVMPCFSHFKMVRSF